MLPPSPMDWLPEGHLARFILDLVKELDLDGIYARYERDLRGFPPYHPQMMVGLLLYAYCVGVPSSRKIERKTYEDVAFRVIAGEAHPDHSRINEFRRVHLEALAGLFAQVLRLCQQAGLVKLGKVALDGTKMKANASKHKAMSYQRMREEEKRLRARVNELLAEAERVDAAEDAEYGVGRHGDELPEELQRSESRRARIRAAKKALEAEARQQQEEEKQAKDRNDPPPGPTETPLPKHRIPTTERGKPTAKSQRNFTDPESRIMKSGDGFIQGFNCQAMVDAEHQVIVAQAVTNQAPDVEHLLPMIAQTVANCGEIPDKMLMDAGYYSDVNACEVEKWKIDGYIATGRRRRNEPPPTVRGRPPANLTIKQRMARKLASKAGAAVYARRKVIVEPVFGQIKEVRGFRRLLLRGLAKVRHEWSLITLTHNLLKLHAACV